MTHTRCRLAAGAAALAGLVVAGCSSSDEFGAAPPGFVIDVQDSLPTLVVTDEGSAYMAPPPGAATRDQFLPDIWTFTITPEGLELLRSNTGSLTTPVTLEQLERIVGPSNIGQVGFLFPEYYVFQATPIASAGGAPIVSWPEGASIGLQAASPCLRLPELEVGEVFETAAADAVFDDDGELFSVVAKPEWPGATCD